jgi:hypothetical protein
MEFSEQRVLRLTMILGAIGAGAVLAKWGWKAALGFAAGAAISWLSFRSFVKLAEAVGASGKTPAVGSAVFLALRYVLIGVAIYAMIESLGMTAAALIAGLLVSFTALIADLIWK